MLAPRFLRSSITTTRLRQVSSVTLRAPLCKQFSSVSSGLTSIAPRRPGKASIRSAGQSRIASFLPLASIRFNSSATTPTTPPAIEAFDTINPLDFSELTEAQKTLPESIGYLHELGLNFGYGPTAAMQWLLEHMHVYTGTPWWVSIIATTVLIRAIQLPFYVKVSDNGAKMKEAAPFAAPIVEDMKNAHAKKNLVAVHLARQQLKDLYEKAGVRKSWMFFPLAQIPVFFGIYNLLRNMSELPVPGLLDGGVAWFTDLTSADPYMILPIFTSTVMAYSIHIGGESGAATMSNKMKFGMMVGLPIISLLFMCRWPAAMTMYFATNAVLGLSQALLFRSPAMRQMLGIYPLSKPEPDAAQTPWTNISPSLRAQGVATAANTRNATINPLSKIKQFTEQAKEVVDVSSVKQTWADNQRKKKYAEYERMKAKKDADRKKAEMEEMRRRKALKEVDTEL